MSELRLNRWTPFEDRFWGRIDKTDGCWLWVGPLNEKGYGRKVGYNKGRVYPHRLAYQLLVGTIPDGYSLDHLCRVRNCVNPAHLEPVLPTENTRRGVVSRMVEPCPNGHPPERRTLPSGKNICLACRRDSDRRRHEENRAERNAVMRERYARSKLIQ